MAMEFSLRATALPPRNTRGSKREKKKKMHESRHSRRKRKIGREACAIVSSTVPSKLTPRGVPIAQRCDNGPRFRTRSGGLENSDVIDAHLDLFSQEHDNANPT